MKTLQDSLHKFSLQVSLDDLHRESKEWINEIEFWDVELTFLEKLLKSDSPLLERDDQLEEKEHFEKLINYYKTGLLTDIKEKIKLHESDLKNLLDENIEQNEEKYRTAHLGLSHKISTFEEEFRELKKEFYQYSGRIIKGI